MALPNSISGLSSWWKADTLALADGAAVSTWADSSGATNPLVQATTASQPIFKVNRRNGLPAVNFNGSHVLTATGITGDTFTSFVVFSSTTGAGISFSNGNADGWGLQLFSGRDLTYLAVSDNSAGTYTNNTWEIWCGARATGTSGQGNLYLNGTSVVSVTGAMTTATAQIYLGNKYNNLAAFTGDISEIINYNRVLTAAERATVDSYLQDRYAIAVSDYIPSAITMPTRIANRNVGPMALRHNFHTKYFPTPAPVGVIVVPTLASTMLMMGIG